MDKLKEAGDSITLDRRENVKQGWKFAEYEAQSIPLRIAVGPRDLENNNVEVARRDTLETRIISRRGLAAHTSALLDTIQNDLFQAVLKKRDERTSCADSYEEFKNILEQKGGFIYAHWDGTEETEKKIKDETKATIRCIPLDGEKEEGKCMVTGKPSSQRVLFAISY